MERLSSKHEGESPKVTLRMDPAMVKTVDREARRKGCGRSEAIRSLLARAGASTTTTTSDVTAVDALRKERDELKRAAERTSEDYERLRARLKAAEEERDALRTERDAATQSLGAAQADAAESRREVERLRAENERRGIARLWAEIESEQQKVAQETSAVTAEVAPTIIVTPDPLAADALRARYKALNVSLRGFVTKYNITRSPFQRWVAGERDTHGETLKAYAAAIEAEEKGE